MGMIDDSLDVLADMDLVDAVASPSAMSRGGDEPIKGLKRVEEGATKHFSKRDADIDAIRHDVTTLMIDSTVMEGMLGFVLAMQVALFVMAFIHESLSGSRRHAPART